MKNSALLTLRITNHTTQGVSLLAQGKAFSLEGGSQVTLEVSSEERAILIANKRLTVKTLRQA